MNVITRNRFQFSLRTLLLLTLAVALLLVPVAWVSRERMQMIRARNAILEAREAALRSVVLEEQRRREAMAARAEAVGPEKPENTWRTPAEIEETRTVQHLERENARLRRQVNDLRRELERVRNSWNPLGTAGR